MIVPSAFFKGVKSKYPVTYFVNCNRQMVQVRPLLFNQLIREYNYPARKRKLHNGKTVVEIQVIMQVDRTVFDSIKAYVGANNE